MDLVFDIETDDLKATKVWCIVAQDVDTKEVFKFTPDKLDEGVKLLQSADKLIGHNIIGFDVPMIKKFFDVDLFKGKDILDTLVLSRLFNPTREGGHSLEKWGFRLGFNKINFEDYLNYSDDMLNYCVRDVELNTKVFFELRKEAKGFSKESVQLEHGIAHVMKKQESNGFKFDMRHAHLLLSELR